MNESPHNWADRLDELVTALHANELSDELAVELNEMLDSQPGARRRFAEQMQLATMLEEGIPTKAAMPAGSAQPVALNGHGKTRRSHRSLAILVSTAAAIGLIGFFLWPHFFGSSNDPIAVTDDELFDEGVAVVTSAVNARFSHDTQLDVGSSVSPGSVVLESGHVQFEFYRGAVVVVEGPAELEFIDANKMICRRGRLRAHVPPQAEGFTVVSRSFELVDLGTEFGMDVSEDGSGRIRVFEGKVELYEAGSNRSAASRREIGETGGARVSATGEVTETDTPEGEFLSAESLRELAVKHDLTRFRAWQKQSEALSNDPRVIVHYSFEAENPSTRSLASHQANDPSLNGAIVGCAWSTGRWFNKGALEFKHPGDRVRVHIPGEYTSLTYAAWVRIDGLDRPFISLLLTNGYNVSEPHWQLRGDGRLLLGIKTPSGHVAYDSKPILSIKDLGRWVHLSTVYDSESRRVSHYVDGAIVSTAKLTAEPFKLKFGDTEIGNWGTPVTYSPQKIRNLNGRIDEFTLFREPLSAEEIQRLYSAGRP